MKNNIFENYFVLGFFYKKDDYILRRYLEIIRKNNNIYENDLCVIMMNPGKSLPKNYDENNPNQYLNKFVEANSDETIKQIIRIMEKEKYKFAKIINLSDIRVTSSKEFYNMLKVELKNYDHSIFSENNKKNIENYLNHNSLFIFAWGVDKKLLYLSKTAINVLKNLYGENIKIIGKKHSKNNYGYYHPLPRNNEERVKWVNDIVNMIQKKMYVKLS